MTENVRIEIVGVSVTVRCPHCGAMTGAFHPSALVPRVPCQECRRDIELFPPRPTTDAPQPDLAIYCDEQWFRDTYGSYWYVMWALSGCAYVG